MTIAKPNRREDIESAIKTAVNQGWQLAIVVLNDVLPELYECVKQWGNQRLGLVTQCVSFQALDKNSGKLRLCKDFIFLQPLLNDISFLDVQNLSQKLNAKIGGINGIVNLKAALSHSSKDDLFMFFGADVKSNYLIEIYFSRKFSSRLLIQLAQLFNLQLQLLSVHVIQRVVVMRHVFVNVGILFLI